MSIATVARRAALAVGTLTVARVRVRGTASVEDLRGSTGFYPIVGLAVGVAPALVLLLPIPPLPRAALALGAWVSVTGALHLDGWADCSDAAFAPARGGAEEMRARRLAILKDPHVGTFGVVGLVLLLLGKWAMLVHLSPLSPLLAAPLGRWGMVYVLHTFPPARKEGLAATLAGPVPLGLATVLLIPALLLALHDVEPLRLVGILAAAGVTIHGTARFLVGRFGGMTGDVCGAVGEAVELVVLGGLLRWSVA